MLPAVGFAFASFSQMVARQPTGQVDFVAVNCRRWTWITATRCLVARLGSSRLSRRRKSEVPVDRPREGYDVDAGFADPLMKLLAQHSVEQEAVAEQEDLALRGPIQRAL